MIFGVLILYDLQHGCLMLAMLIAIRDVTKKSEQRYRLGDAGPLGQAEGP